jgi:hypothetical protein
MDFIPGGLQKRDDLMTIDTSALIADFTAN